jgi:hypothetical protein
MSFTSDEVNYLIYRYLQESGKFELLIFLYRVKVCGSSDTKCLKISLIRKCDQNIL